MRDRVKVVFGLAGLLVFIILPLLAFAAGAAGAEENAPVSKGDGGGKTLVVTSDRMEADNASRLVIFRGNVEAVEDFLLCSDELRVTYGEDNTVADIVAVGNVRIFQQGKTANSGKAVYDRVKRTLVLTDDPVVEQCSDTVRGDRIVFYMEEDRALVESSGGGRVRAVIMPEKKCPEGPSEAPAGPREGGEDTRCTGAR